MLLVQQLVYLVAGLVQIRVQNNLSRPIWVVVDSFDNSISGQSNSFGLKPGEKRTFHQAVDWSGRIWARGWDGINQNVCENGYCTYPNEYYDPYNPGYPGYPGYPQQKVALTVAEIKLQARNGLDQYDISLADGFNVPIAITPDGGKGECRTITCDYYVVLECPPDLYSFTEFRGCDSYCNRFNNDEYCCRGPYDQPFSCNPYNWPTNTAMHFKKECPDAYTYKYDLTKGQNTCSKAVQYTVTFG